MVAVNDDRGVIELSGCLHLLEQPAELPLHALHLLEMGGMASAPPALAHFPPERRPVAQPPVDVTAQTAVAAVDVRAVRNQEVREVGGAVCASRRSEEHTSELQSLMRISYAVFCLK